MFIKSFESDSELDSNEGTSKKSFSMEMEVSVLLDDGNDYIMNLAADKFHNTSKSNSKKDYFDENDEELLTLAAEKYEVEQKKRQRLIPKTIQNNLLEKPSEIKRKKLRALIRQHETLRGCHGRYMKDYLSEHFWIADEWPAFAMEILVSNDFSYHDRISLATFMHGNGFRDGDMAANIVKFYKSHRRIRCFDPMRWKRKYNKFAQLFSWLNKTYTDPEMATKYWYYDLNLNLTMFYDGTVRTSSGESIPYRKYSKY